MVFGIKAKQKLEQIIVDINSRIQGLSDIIYGILINTETGKAVRLQRLKQKIRSTKIRFIQLKLMQFQMLSFSFIVVAKL